MEIPDDILPLIDHDEKVLFSVKQKRYRPAINIESIIITSKRIILRKPFMMGIKKNYVDYSYDDITNIIIDKGLSRSTIMLNLNIDANSLVIENIPNQLAQQAFQIIRREVDQRKRPSPTS